MVKIISRRAVPGRPDVLLPGEITIPQDVIEKMAGRAK